MGEDFVIVVVSEGGPRPVAFHACAPAGGPAHCSCPHTPHGRPRMEGEFHSTGSGREANSNDASRVGCVCGDRIYRRIGASEGALTQRISASIEVGIGW